MVGEEFVGWEIIKVKVAWKVDYKGLDEKNKENEEKNIFKDFLDHISIKV